jgi:sec-independent protein translocase protein TatB
MLSVPHLIVLFVVALVIFGPEKLPELARMLGKYTADFRKMSGDFRYALEEEVRELERQTRLKEAEAANAVAAAALPKPAPAEPEGVVPREQPAHDDSSPTVTEPPPPSEPEIATAPVAVPEAEPRAHEKPSDDHTAV